MVFEGGNGAATTMYYTAGMKLVTIIELTFLPLLHNNSIIYTKVSISNI